MVDEEIRDKDNQIRRLRDKEKYNDIVREIRGEGDRHIESDP